MVRYNVIVIREAGNDPLTGSYFENAQEEMQIEAETEYEAYQTSQRKCSLPFFGQVRRTFIDGKEYFNPRF